MKFLVLISLATIACASVYETPYVKSVILKESDLKLHPVAISPKSYLPLPLKSHPVLSVQSVHHPALLDLHYPVEKYTVHYPSGLYHGPHGVGPYDPKLHDEQEQAYYRG